MWEEITNVPLVESLRIARYHSTIIWYINGMLNLFSKNCDFIVFLMKWNKQISFIFQVLYKFLCIIFNGKNVACLFWGWDKNMKMRCGKHVPLICPLTHKTLKQNLKTKKLINSILMFIITIMTKRYLISTLIKKIKLSNSMLPCEFPGICYFDFQSGNLTNDFLFFACKCKSLKVW